MDYYYDVFLSYTRAFPFGTWVHEHFLPLFQGFLDNELPPRAKLFVDNRGIYTGDSWPARLKEALSRSKCLVGIWSPSYFNSDWCRCECAIMHYRQQQLGYGCATRPDGLIVPVRVHDGETFPQFARDMQQFDFRKYARVGVGFTKTERYVEFQDAVANFAVDVARVIACAPSWSADWANREWMDDVIDTLEHLDSPPIINQPTLC